MNFTLLSCLSSFLFNVYLHLILPVWWLIAKLVIAPVFIQCMHSKVVRGCASPSLPYKVIANESWAWASLFFISRHFIPIKDQDKQAIPWGHLPYMVRQGLSLHLFTQRVHFKVKIKRRFYDESLHLCLLSASVSRSLCVNRLWYKEPCVYIACAMFEVNYKRECMVTSLFK